MQTFFVAYLSIFICYPSLWYLQHIIRILFFAFKKFVLHSFFCGKISTTTHWEFFTSHHPISILNDISIPIPLASSCKLTSLQYKFIKIKHEFSTNEKKTGELQWIVTWFSCWMTSKNYNWHFDLWLVSVQKWQQPELK